MNANVRWRMAVLVLSIGLLVGLSVWAACVSWERFNTIRKRLLTVQSESFRFADHFQQSLLNMNSLLLHYQLRNDPLSWQQFLRRAEELDQWITTHTPAWDSTDERDDLVQLKSHYKAYLTAARHLEYEHAPGVASMISSADFLTYEAQSKRLVDLAYRLANAHRHSLNQFLNDSDRSLLHLRNLLLGSLLLLLLFGTGLAREVYRQLIEPLRLKIMENRELLARQEKLASLGMLAAGVAHEIRNPLTAMKARVFALERLLGRDTPEQSDLAVIGQEINRLERIVKDFLLFARPSEPVLTIVDARQPLGDVKTLMAAQLEKADIGLKVEPSEALPIAIDVQQISQVLINLVQNAAESIGQHGTITLRARREGKRLSGNTIEKVILEVEDTGKGIPPDVQKRLFDPFFTTKPSGTGLGLSIAARIVEKHGGALQYQSQVNRGTVFGIVLPAVKSR